MTLSQDHQYKNESIPVMLAHLIEQAKQPQNLWECAWAALCHAFFVLGIGILLWMTWDFQFHGNTDIVGWVTVHKYPKHQEIVAYLGAFVCVLVGIVGGWYCWCLLALIFQRLKDYNVSYSLRWAALSFSGYLASFFFIMLGQWHFTTLFLIPMVLVLLTVFIFSFWKIPFAKRQCQKPFSGSPFPVADLHAPQPLPPGQSYCSHPGKAMRLVILVLIPVLIYFYFFDASSHAPPPDPLNKDIDLFHEGEKLAPLNTLLRGGLPFRDIYVQHGLFEDVGKPWLAALLNAPSLASLRLTEAFLAPLGYVALYFLGLQVFRFWPTALILVLLTSSTHPYLSSRQALGLLTVAVLAGGIRHSYFYQSPPIQLHYDSFARRRFAVSGTLTTLAFFFSTDTGLFALAACAVFLIIHGLTRSNLQNSDRWSPLWFYVAGVLLAFMPFILYFWWAGVLTDFFCNTYTQCAYEAAVWGFPFPPLLPELQKVSSFAAVKTFLAGRGLWYLPVAVYLITAGILSVRFVKDRFWESQANAIILLVLLFGVIQFYSALGRSDVAHFIYATSIFWIFPLYVLEYGFVFLKQYLPWPRSAAQKVSLTLAVALATGCFGKYVSVIHRPLKTYQERAWRIVTGQTLPKKMSVIWERLGGVQISEGQYKHLRRMVDFIQRHTTPNEPIFDFSNQGALYFFADRPSPTRYHMIIYAADSKMQLEVIRGLEKTNTKLVIYTTGEWLDKFDGIPNSEREWLVAKYIQTHFTKKVTLDGTVILLK